MSREVEVASEPERSNPKGLGLLLCPSGPGFFRVPQCFGLNKMKTLENASRADEMHICAS